MKKVEKREKSEDNNKRKNEYFKHHLRKELINTKQSIIKLQELANIEKKRITEMKKEQYRLDYLSSPRKIEF